MPNKLGRSLRFFRQDNVPMYPYSTAPERIKEILGDLHRWQSKALIAMWLNEPFYINVLGRLRDQLKAVTHATTEAPQHDG